MRSSYFFHKAFQLRRWLFRSGKQVRRLRTWWEVYFVLLVGFLYMNLVDSGGSWILFSWVTFIILFLITVFMDYGTGADIHWERQQKEERNKEEAFGVDYSLPPLRWGCPLFTM